VKEALTLWGGGVRGGGPNYANNVAANAANGVAPPPIWGGDAQAFGRNVGDPTITEPDVLSADGDAVEGSEVIGFTEGTGIKYGLIRPTAGMKVLQFEAAARNSSDPTAISTPEKTVPTSEIQFVTFASHALSLSTLVVREAKGGDYGANLPQPSQAAIADLFRGYLLRTTSSTPDETMQERYTEVYTELINDIATTLYDNAERPLPKRALQNTAYPSNPVASYLQFLEEARSQYSDLSFVLQNVKAASGEALDLSLTVLDNFTGTNAPRATAEARGTKAVCSVLSQGAATFYTLVLTSLQDAAQRQGKTGTYDVEEMTALYNEAYGARNAYLQDYASTLGVPFTPPTTPTGEVKITFAKYTGTNTYTPVFPISDARGYEVVGSQRYGRGLNASTYKAVMESTREVTSDGLTLSSRAVIGDISTNATTFEAIEAFYIALASRELENVENAVPLAFSKLSTAQQTALLTAAADLALTSDGTAPTTFNPTLLSNLVAASGNYGQRWQYASNIPARLADIQASTTNPTPCSCKTSDAQAYLLASTGEYVQVGTEAEVNDFLLGEARLKAKTWQQARDAMSGQTLDPAYSSLAEQFTNAAQNAGAAISNTGATASSVVRNLTPGVE
jgi:hypothetical protein